MKKIYCSGAESGPTITIQFIDQEANGEQLELTRPFHDLKPKRIDDLSFVAPEELEVGKGYYGMYPCDKLFYKAKVMKIKNKTGLSN